MKQYFLLITVVFALVLLAACGSDSNQMNNQMQGNMEKQMQDSESMPMGEGNTQLMSSEEWIRSEPINVKALDASGREMPQVQDDS